jgi:valyl-tRNA synthetase
MYEPQETEKKWNAYWKEKKIFLFQDKDGQRPFVIDTPPPFTNGELHMGQIFWVSYIDSIARYERLKGRNVLYPIGWDMHGFPTELAVEKKYGRKMSREDFYAKCVELSSDNIKKMKDQMLALGATFDDRYEYFTTSKEYTAKVQLSLLQMHEKGMIYRELHPVMWCTKCASGIGNPETEELKEESSLNYLVFKIKGSKDTITVATTRPELLHACVAVAVNKDDRRYKKLIGSSAVTPIFGKVIAIIGDQNVDKEFGTGAEMVCTYGDRADIEIAIRNKLKFIEAIDNSGKLKNAAKYDGMSLMDARSAITTDLSILGALVKQEKTEHVVKIHDRCSTRTEFINAKQWFIKTKEYSKKIRQLANEIDWHPEHTKQRLFDWVDFMEWDWNISRNRVFGTPIPFWACEKCDHVVTPDKEALPVDTNTSKPPVAKCPKCGGEILSTKETADGWVDTSITPLIIAGWPYDKDLFKRAYPNNVRIQGTDIVRTWAFYTIFRSYFVGGNKPFEQIIVHGMIQGIDGKEMHKRFGNGIFLGDLMPKYSADAVRLWVALSGGIGKDKPFSYNEMDFAKSFVVKLYNSANFVKMALEKGKLPKTEPHDYLNVFDIWILNRLNQTIKEVTEAYDQYNLNVAMSKMIEFYWHEFADYYIENVKHRVYSEEKKMENSKKAALFTLRYVLDMSLRMLAPVVPFVCEEANSMFTKDSIFKQSFPLFTKIPRQGAYVIYGLLQKSPVEVNYDDAGAILNDVIAQVRKEKAKNRIALNKEIASININLPDEYYSVVSVVKDELKSICKAQKVEVKKAKEFSVSIKL